MSTILEQSPKAILNNYADVIEGGNSYRGSGTKFYGIPGTDSHDADVEALSVTAEASSDTDTLKWSTASSWVGSRLESTDVPPYFVVCLTATQSGNVGLARRISSVTSTQFELDSAFPYTITTGDTFSVRQGFKRAPDNYDINSSEDGAAWDRYFSLSMGAGKRGGWYGNGIAHFETDLSLRVRFLKRSRSRQTIDSALENILKIRSILERGDMRDSTYVQVLEISGDAPEIETNDLNKVVILDKYRLVYRVQNNFA